MMIFSSYIAKTILTYSELIDALEKRMNHEVAFETLFTVRWEVI